MKNASISTIIRSSNAIKSDLDPESNVSESVIQMKAINN